MQQTPIHEKKNQASRIFVVTCLFGRYEQLNENDIYENHQSVRYLCFTDNQELESTKWEGINSRLPNDPLVNSRLAKMLQLYCFPQDSLVIYKDNSVTLKKKPSVIAQELLNEKDLAFFKHQNRKYFIDEIVAIYGYELASLSEILSFLKIVACTYASPKKAKLFWGGFFGIRINSATRLFLEDWIDYYKHFTRRDQPALALALDSHSDSVSMLDFPNTESKWHKWPTFLNREVNRRYLSGQKPKKVKIVWRTLFANLTIRFIFNFWLFIHSVKRLRRS